MKEFPPFRLDTVNRFCLALLCSAHRALGNYVLARDHLITLRDEMDHHTVIHDWHHRMVLQSLLAVLWLGSGDMQQARGEADTFLGVTHVTADQTLQEMA